MFWRIRKVFCLWGQNGQTWKCFGDDWLSLRLITLIYLPPPTLRNFGLKRWWQKNFERSTPPGNHELRTEDIPVLWVEHLPCGNSLHGYWNWPSRNSFFSQQKYCVFHSPKLSLEKCQLWPWPKAGFPVDKHWHVRLKDQACAIPDHLPSRFGFRPTGRWESPPLGGFFQNGTIFWCFYGGV